MTNNYHDVLPTNAPLQSAVIEDRLSDLDAGITGLAAGSTSLTGLNLGAAGALTISGGVVTRTAPRHTVDTESSASTDDLTTINGGATGDVLIISAANSSRVVTVKHGTGNIYLYSKLDKVLDDTDKQITLIYSGARWWEIGGLPTTALTYPTSAPWRRPSGMPVQLTPAARNRWEIRASAATVQGVGIAAPTAAAASGTIANNNQADSTYTSFTTGATTGNSGSIVTASYNLVRRAHNAKMSMVIMMGDITSVRFFIGFCSAALTSADTIAGATEAACFRFSTATSDAGFVPVTKDASTQTTGAAMNTIATSTRYLLEIELTSSSAIFTVNNGTPVVQTTNLPTTSTDLGFNFLLVTLANAAKAVSFSRMFVEFD